jgi:hypothetical protein
MPGNPTTRYPNGVVNAAETAPYGNHLQPKPDTYYTYFNDFFAYTATDWLVTETDAGSTEAIVAAGEGGQLAITNVSAGATDAASLQLSYDGGTTAGTQFLWESGKDMVIAARFKLDAVAATTTAALIGLAIADTTPVASLPANGIFFYKAAAAATFVASARKAGTSTSVTMNAMVADTFTTAVFYYTASDGTWRAFQDGVFVGSFSTASVSPVVALTPTIGLLNASAAAHVLTVDYIYCAKQR